MNTAMVQNLTAFILAVIGIGSLWVSIRNSRTLTVDQMRDDLNTQYNRVVHERDELQREKDSWREWIREAIVNAIAEGLATRLANRRATDANSK